MFAVLLLALHDPWCCIHIVTLSMSVRIDHVDKDLSFRLDHSNTPDSLFMPVAYDCL